MFRAYSQGLATGDEHHQSATPRQEVSYEAGGGHHVLEVVEDDQVALVREDLLKQRFERCAAVLLHADGLRQSRRHLLRIANGGQIDEPHVLEVGRELGGHLEGQSRLAGPAGAGQRDQARAVLGEQRAQGCQLGVTVHERPHRKGGPRVPKFSLVGPVQELQSGRTSACWGTWNIRVFPDSGGYDAVIRVFTGGHRQPRGLWSGNRRARRGR